jgi:hypothetical protein
MLSKLWSLVEIIRGLIHLFDVIRERLRRREEEKKGDELNRAIDDSKRAKTEEEIFDSQDRIIDNK